MECASSDINSPTSAIKKLEEYIIVLEKTNKEQAQTILELQSLLAISQPRIAELESKITELEARIGLNSGNSSFPASRDLGKRQTPVSLREKTGKKAGGQNNAC